MFLAGLCLLLVASESPAQRRSRIPKPETEELTTKDGVEVSVTYYPSTAGRDATPVILVHDLKGSRRDFTRLAKRLQQPAEEDAHKSFAVLTIDLRGHGDSRKQTIRGRELELDAAKLGVQDVAGMVLGDMEEARKFLVKQNDEGKLNLNRLSLVGVGMGAVVATNFAARDWAIPKLAAVKQGQDVKALVLVSPDWKVKGLAMQKPLRQPGVQREVAVMLHYGSEDRRAKKNADRIFGQLDRYHDDAKEADPVEVMRSKDTLSSLLSIAYNTKLQGSQLLKEAGARVDGIIAAYLYQHTAKEEFKYSSRTPE